MTRTSCGPTAPRSATFALSIVGYLELLDLKVRPRYLLGHSLGEFSALVAAGLLTIEDGARLIGVRGAAMARAAAATEGSMVALMGGDDGARAALEGVDDVWVANINGTGQIVVSGTRAGLDDLLACHRELGWRRATPLAVGGAFHSPLMKPAQAELDRALTHVQWGATEAVLIANVDAQVHTSAEEWRDLLSRQLTSPVEFLDATLALPDECHDHDRDAPERRPHRVSPSASAGSRCSSPPPPSTTCEDSNMSRHVIVTGASRGIGAAIAQYFIDEGDNVVAMSRSGSAPVGCAASFAVDVADSTAVNDAVKEAIGEFGPVNVLVANAGVTSDGLAMRMSDAQWRDTA